MDKTGNLEDLGDENSDYFFQIFVEYYSLLVKLINNVNVVIVQISPIFYDKY